MSFQSIIIHLKKLLFRNILDIRIFKHLIKNISLTYQGKNDLFR